MPPVVCSLPKRPKWQKTAWLLGFCFSKKGMSENTRIVGVLNRTKSIKIHINLYKNFFDYPVDINRRIYSVLMESIRRIKLGENSETVMAECLTQSLTVLKEKNYV